MSEQMAGMKTLAPDVYWDENRDTIYVRGRGLALLDASGFILRFREVLSNDPENAGIRFLLSSYLETAGLHQEAQAELQQVAHSSDEIWSVKARQALEPSEPL